MPKCLPGAHRCFSFNHFSRSAGPIWSSDSHVFSQSAIYWNLLTRGRCFRSRAVDHGQARISTLKRTHLSLELGRTMLGSHQIAIPSKFSIFSAPSHYLRSQHNRKSASSVQPSLSSFSFGDLNLRRRGRNDPRRSLRLIDYSNHARSCLLRARRTRSQEAAVRLFPLKDYKPTRSSWSADEPNADTLFETLPNTGVFSPGALKSSFQGNAVRRRLRRFHYAWFPAFARIVTKYFDSRVLETTPVVHISAGRLIEPQTPQRGTVDETPATRMLKAWKALGPRRQRRYSLSALLSVLFHDLELSATLLQSIFSRKTPPLPIYAAADSVMLICHTFLTQKPTQNVTEESARKTMDLCLELATQCLKAYPGVHQNGTFSPYFIGTLARHSNDDQLKKWINALHECDHPLLDSDILFLAELFGGHSDFISARNLLVTLRRETIASDRMTVACTKILLATPNSEEAYRHQTQFLTAMLELGVRPDARMRDAIMVVALRGGDVRLAWESHQQAIKGGLEPSAATYIYLLRSVSSDSSIRTVLRIYHEARELHLVRTSPPLGGAIISATRRALLGQSPGRRYDTMLAVYAEIFDLEPLNEVGITQKRGQESGAVLQPPVGTLQEMLVSWIDVSNDLHQLGTVYQHWSQLSAAGTSRVALTGNTCMVFRAFMTRFGRLGDQRMASKIMQDLLQDRFPIYSSVARNVNSFIKEQIGNLKPLEKPGVREWTKLVQTFTLNQQFDEAEEVVRVMRDHGIEPDARLYEVLLEGYAGNQDIANAMRLMKEKQQAGFELDGWTIKSLGRIQDRRALRGALSSTQFADAPNEYEPLGSGLEEGLEEALDELKLDEKL